VAEIVVERDASVAVVRLNRPERGNSVTPDVVDELVALFEGLTGDADVRALVLTGTGTVFCAGADVQQMHAVFVSAGIDGICDYLSDVWMPAVQRLVRVLWSMPKPIVAALNGSATAGGLDFALTCDLRIASDRAKFAESYVNLGMVPVAGGLFLLPLTIGLSAATELLATGELIDARRALELGLVASLHSDTELLPVAKAAAARLGSAPADTFADTKRIARQRWLPELDRALEESLNADNRLIRTPLVRQRLISVMEKFSAQR